MALFILFPILGFLLGMQYQKAKSPLSTPTPPQEQTVCPHYAIACPDGSSVHPQGPKCEVPSCPGSNSNPIATPSADITSWKTYTSIYKYSVQYPSTWKEKAGCEGGNYDYICFLSDDFEEGPAGAVEGGTVKGGLIWIDANPKAPLIGSPAQEYCKDGVRQAVVIAGYKSLKCTSTGLPYVDAALVQNEKILIIFRAIYNKDSEKRIVPIFDQVVSTFKSTP